MAVVAETADHVVVFDTGPRYSADADAGNRVLVPYLRSRGLARIDALIVSHPDIDHAGGARSLLSAIAVDRVWTSIAPGHRLLGNTLQPVRCEAGQRLALGGLSLEVLHPDVPLYAQARATTNARSCVVLVQIGSHRVLLTGDIPQLQEQQMLARARTAGQDLRVALLLAPHHGSHSSSSEALITATAPQWVSMQLGYRNHYGHPHAQVVERYRSHGVVVVRSDQYGAAQWRFAAAGTTVECWRRDHARYWFNQPAAGAADLSAPCGAAGPAIALSGPPGTPDMPAAERR
jgi:competence protein ComEC